VWDCLPDHSVVAHRSEKKVLQSQCITEYKQAAPNAWVAILGAGGSGPLKSSEKMSKRAEHGKEGHERARRQAHKKQSNNGSERVLGQELKTKAQILFQGQTHHKKQRKMVILNQWIEVEFENGQTVTTLYPSNEELIEEGKAMFPPPDMVYRRLNFPATIPPEYYWVTENPEARARGGTGIQRMMVDTWLEVIEREKADGTGHVGPTGSGSLPRPIENGVCECAVCTRNAAILERMQNEPA
jgi:hypothetical protein